MRRAVVIGVAIGIALSSTVAYGSWQKSGTARHAYARYATTFGCSSPGTQTAGADRDVYVRHSLPTSNFNTGNNGVTNQFQVVSFSGGAQRTLIHFTLPTKPSGCTVTAAVLTVNTVTCASATPNQLNLKPITSAPTTWTENAVTWNNQPAFSGDGGSPTTEVTTTTGQVAQHTLTSTDCNTAPRAITFSGGGLPASVLSMYTTNTGWEIQLNNETTGSGAADAFTSREAGTSASPTLAVTFG